MQHRLQMPQEPVCCFVATVQTAKCGMRAANNRRSSTADVTSNCDDQL